MSDRTFDRIFTWLQRLDKGKLERHIAIVSDPGPPLLIEVGRRGDVGASEPVLVSAMCLDSYEPTAGDLVWVSRSGGDLVVHGLIVEVGAGGGGGSYSPPIPQSDVTGLTAALSAKQDASTAATDSELSAGLATKQDASSAATDSELSAGLATKQPLISAGTSLPGSPTDGDIYIFNADATNGVKWQFQFRNAGTSGKKWEFIGGPPLVLEDPDARSLTNQTTYASLPTDPLSLTLPALAGDFDFECQANILPISAGSGTYSYDIGGAGASDNDCAQASLAALTSCECAKRSRKTGLSASTVITEKAKTGGNYTVTFSRRRIAIWPVRVG